MFRCCRLIRAWLKAGVMEEGKVTHPDRGSPQGGVISPTLSNIFLHEVDRQWCRSDGSARQKTYFNANCNCRIEIAVPLITPNPW